MSDPDPLVEEMVRARRDRLPLVIAVSLGIVLGVALAMATFLGALDGGDRYHTRNHAAFAFFGPLIGCMAIGYVVYRVRTRRRR